MTGEKTPYSFNLPFNQSSCYWLAVFPGAAPAAFPGSVDTLETALLELGMQPIASPAGGYMMRLERTWSEAWGKIYELLAQQHVQDSTDAALIAGEEEPYGEQLAFARKPAHLITALAGSLWLGEAMLKDSLVCYMQPVIDKRGKVFGYEAFARVETGGAPIGGGKIIEASRGLNAEYMLDRHLHIKAITSFIESDLEGFLFINFVPGFIHRPEKYLEGLSDAARFSGMPARQIVLDFTQSETPRDLAHHKAIFDYCRSKGYSLSLDDISTTAMAAKILETIRPDFIKLDINLVCGARDAAEHRTIAELVSLAHTAGASVLAEGVETEDIHRELLKADVDLFQGYLFSPPVAVSALKKAAG